MLKTKLSNFSFTKLILLLLLAIVSLGIGLVAKLVLNGKSVAAIPAAQACWDLPPAAGGGGGGDPACGPGSAGCGSSSGCGTSDSADCADG